MSQVHPESALPSRPTQSARDTQVGGDHYAKLGAYQPWEVLKRWLTPEEFRGYMKGTAIAYLAREQDKGKDQDIEKAMHTLQGLVEMAFTAPAPSSAVHSDAKTTSRCAESHYKAVCAEQGHRWTYNPATGDHFCGVCMLDMPIAYAKK